VFGLQLSCVSPCLREVSVFHCWILRNNCLYDSCAVSVAFVSWFSSFWGLSVRIYGKRNVTTPLDGVGPLEGPCLKPLLSNRLTYFLHCLSPWVSSDFLFFCYWFSSLFVVNFVRLVCIIDWPKENSMAACDVVWLVFPTVLPHFEFCQLVLS